MTGPVLMVIAAALIAVAVIIVVWASRRRPGTDRRGADRRPSGGTGGAGTDPLHDHDADALRGDPTALRPGDLAEIRGHTYAVRGTLRLAEGAWSWAEHLLDDADGGQRWLSVEQDPDLELALWTKVPSATVKPGGPTVSFEGRRYVREESGRARFSSVGATGLDPTGLVEYQDYAAPDGPLLSFERFGGEHGGAGWEVARGERLHRAELQIFPQGG